MNKLNDAISKALEGIRVDEGTLTPALQKALTCKNMQVKRECDKCGFKIPKYKGRYPKHCPECGDAVTDADKEVLASDEPQTEDPGIERP